MRVFAVGAFSALWVGANLVFDQAYEVDAISALSGGIVDFVFFALIDGNRALQTIGPRDDVRRASTSAPRMASRSSAISSASCGGLSPAHSSSEPSDYLLLESVDPKQRLLSSSPWAAVGVILLLGLMLDRSTCPP
ncbi:MAG: hypothetical protein R2706_16810 [Acidimicrobiales bacterium]